MSTDLRNLFSNIITGGRFTNRKLILILLTLILSSGVCLADNYVGGIPLTSAHSGTVDGGIFYDSYYGTGDQQTKVPKTIEKTFTLPNNADVEWAMLLTTVYCGHMQNNYQGTANVSFNGQTLGNETLNVPFTYLTNGGEGYVQVNDHVNRVTSDYMMYYDVTDHVKSGENKAIVNTAPLDSSFDGRVKLITLVVAYNDGSGKKIWYQVNRGHDVDSYYNDDELGENYIGSTAFEAALPADSTLTDAELTLVHLASSDGTYTFNGNTLESGTPQGTYTGSDTWDVKSSLKSSGTNTLTYDRTEAFYKNALGILTAEYTESQEPAPVANFTTNVQSGTVPLTVQFTDTSTGTLSSYAWDFNNDGSIDSTQQNPSYTYATAGTYSVNLTVTNAGGIDSELKTDYITVNSGATNDLTISGVVNPVPSSAVFAKEANPVRINTIRNTGTATLTNISVALYASDVSNGEVPVNTTTIASLASEGTTAVILIDPTIRALEGGSVTYTAVIDSDNLISETNETNNNKISTAKPVKYNGYKGKRYWEGGSDITTKKTYDLQGNLIYFTQPSSAYKAVGWTDRTETWTESDLPITSGSTVQKAFLYLSYNWDTTTGGVPSWAATFNGNTLTDGTLYTDRSNFGSYPNQTYGLYVFDVTDQFKSSGNSLVMTANSGNSNALYPSTLVVIYNNSAETRKQIFINEECDELGYSESNYGTTMEEATAYAPFTGMSIDVSTLQNAKLYSFAGSAGPDEGNLLFNGNAVASKAWQGDPSTSSAQAFDVKDYVKETGNEAGIQGTESGGMDALQQILVIEYPASAPVAPVANFTSNVTMGDSPLDVQFTDTSTGVISSYAWDFNNDGTVDSTEQNPLYTYTTEGTYTAKLTVTGSEGSDDEVKTGYIVVNESLPTSPVAAFSAIPTSGDAPLTVNFTDESTGTPTEWLWDFGDGTDASEQNPVHTYTSSGNYTVNLTVSNKGGSNSTVKANYINATGASTPTDQPDLIVSAITLNADEIFANEANNISAKIENRGKAASGSFTVRFILDDFDANVTANGLAVGENTTLNVTDPAIRALGDNVTVSVVADSEGIISESNETNNSLTLAKTVVYNGYKGKRYTGGNDITTQATLEGKYGLVYSTGNTAYNGNNWTVKTYTWSPADLAVSTGAKVVSARLYQPYTWNKMTTDPSFTMSFNNNVVTPIASYKDRKSYGTYDYPSGTYVYNVTSLFDPAGNSITLTPEAGNDYGIYGAYLVVVYEDPTTTEKKILINDEFDLLTSKSSYAVTSDEATAYSPFNDVNTTGISKATAIAVMASGNDANKSKFYFNDQEYAGFWTDYKTIPQIGFSSYDVTGAIQNGLDTARIQSYDAGAGGDSMSAMNAILVIEYLGGSNTTEIPVADFTGTPTMGDFPLTVNFTDLSAGEPSSWAWDFENDGTIDNTGQNPSHTYTLAGNYTVALTVTNEAGNNSTVKTEYIIVSEPGTIQSPPIAAFTSDITSGIAPLTVNFTDQSLGAPVSWNWDFGDGAYSTKQNVSHTFASAGIYTVNLTVSNENGTNSTSASITVSENPVSVLPVASFSSNVSEGYAPLTVQFTDQSQNATGWSWDFGDGVNSTEQNPIHAYSTAGAYTVNLTVSNANGMNSTLANITVFEKVAPVLPVANFSTDVSSGYAPLTVQFTDLSENVTTCNWDFGDGTSSTEKNPAHTYSAAGNYTANLTVSNENGTASRSAMITVLKEPAVPPVADFRSDVTTGFVPLAVQFTDLSKYATEWKWDFGDGTSSTEQNPLHTYSAAGNYTVTLTVNNEAGTDTETKADHIIVNPVSSNLVAAFIASPTSGDAPLKVAFTDSSTGSPTSWKWSFGDGTYSTSRNPVHTYSKAGKYTVSLTVKNARGSNTVTKSQYISVSNSLKAPVACFSASPSSGYAPLKVAFTDRSKGTPTSWKWSFGDGTYSTAKNPVHTYSKAGKYTVSLTVKNRAGKSTITGSNYIKVASPLKTPVAAFSASPTSGKVPLKVQFTDRSSGSPTSWKWSFGDGTYSTAKDPSHTYSKAGKYTVSLKVKNAKGSNTKTIYGYIIASKRK